MRGPAKLLVYTLIAGFLLLVGGAVYWQVGQREILASHPGNPQQLHRRRQVRRGGIYASCGEVIAESLEQSSGFQRVYRGTPGLAPMLGYCSQRYGRAGLEKELDGLLMGWQYPGESAIGRIRHLLSDQSEGYSLVTTIDLRLQKTVERVFGNRKGAAVVMEVKSGRILAIASLPGFTPNEIDANWSAISTDVNSPLYNRALAGFYPPGSTFKLIVLAAGLTSKDMQLATRFEDLGSITIEGQKIVNAGGRAWGQISLLDALVVSSNAVFVKVAQEIGGEGLLQMASRFGLGSRPSLQGGNPSAGKLPTGKLSSLELAQMAIGQYGLVTTPLQMAVVVQTIANDGLMMEPLLVEEVHAPGNGGVMTRRPSPIKYVISAEVARQVRGAMAEAVSRGTGQKASLDFIDVAGKTGSAENPQGPAHAWFVGMAPVTKPVVCLAVVVENGGSGGNVAAPLAREILQAYFQGSTGD